MSLSHHQNRQENNYWTDHSSSFKMPQTHRDFPLSPRNAWTINTYTTIWGWHRSSGLRSQGNNLSVSYRTEQWICGMGLMETEYNVFCPSIHAWMGFSIGEWGIIRRHAFFFQHHRALHHSSTHIHITGTHRTEGTGLPSPLSLYNTGCMFFSTLIGVSIRNKSSQQHILVLSHQMGVGHGQEYIIIRSLDWRHLLSRLQFTSKMSSHVIIGVGWDAHTPLTWRCFSCSACSSPFPELEGLACHGCLFTGN